MSRKEMKEEIARLERFDGRMKKSGGCFGCKHAEPLYSWSPLGFFKVFCKKKKKKVEVNERVECSSKTDKDKFVLLRRAK